MTELVTASRATEHRARWKWFLILGVVLVGLGIAGVGAATLLELTSLLVFGPLLLVSSIVQVLTAFFAEERKERLLHFAAAGLEAVFGFVIMANPLQRVVDLITLIAIFLLMGGLIRLARAVATPSRGRVMLIGTGMIALLLGLTVLVEGPVARLALVGLCIALDFICHGISWSALAFAERKPLEGRVA
jgi:uncharacterized membrane protein HdeD (DUF308 family)